jgi:hypothetical protein
LQLICGVCRVDDHIKLEFYKQLKELASSFTEKQNQVIIEQISGISPDKVINEELTAIFDLSKSNSN